MLLEDRANGIDTPLDQLHLKYYNLVQVDLVRMPSESSAGTPLVTASAGEGHMKLDPAAPSSVAAANERPASKQAKPDSPAPVKTLADQVAEGKYGLIHRELFQRRPHRVGVLSYQRNEEVPLDDERNYGGLSPDEIWLAEDHLLVLKGGSISFNNNHPNRSVSSPSAVVWKPIDDYRAPDRQVQIPANPSVPPPFPVQLRENGPIEFIRGHQTAAFNPFTNESAFLFTNKAFPVIRPEDFGGQNILAGPAAHNGTGQHHGVQYPAPVHPPPVSDNRTYSNPFLKLPPLEPPLGLPLGLPPQGSLDDAQNRTGVRDEDDPSLYYPPPYTFEYRANYTNPVPPGPLVPGIILPPPPNFFILKPTPGTNGTTGGAGEPAGGSSSAAKPIHRPSPGRPTSLLMAIPVHKTPATMTTATVTRPPARVEIQKAVLKSFVPVIEVYEAGPLPKPTAVSKRPRVKPATVPDILSTTTTTTTAATPTTPLLTPSTKLHKIPHEVHRQPGGSGPLPVKAQAHPIYAEYFNIKSTSTPSFWGDVVSPTPHPPRTYLPAKVRNPGHQSNEFISTYGYSPIEQFHREVHTIRQTLQIYEKANKLSKASRTSKVHPVHHYARPEPAPPGNAVYHTVFSDVAPQSPVVGPHKYASTGSGTVATAYANYEPQAPASPPPPPPASFHHTFRPSTVQELPPSYYVTTTTGDGAPFGTFGRIYPSYVSPDQTGSHLGQPQHYYQQQLPAEPKYPPQTDLSYIAPVILNNGASGYNRQPTEVDGTTTKSYLILDHRTAGRLRERQPRPSLVAPPPGYLGYRTNAANSAPYEAGLTDQGLPARDRYLEGDILVNYKHPLPALNPDSEYLPYHHRLKVRKRQNHRQMASEPKAYPSTGQPLYSHR
ncbi:uncharacterized protein LOC131213515 [Anopheles bellator]|uniref:uncharacterized protein LOC131213515 n=1 Tax=Anopheles bellator TaxID=139047 RepID=UPI0026490326|nr:uncharacterized protein LOC131213515 [Anopheles bellator]